MQCISDLQSAFSDWYLPLHPHMGGYRGGMRDTLLQRSALRGTPAPLTRADPLTEGFVPNTEEASLGAGYRPNTTTAGGGGGSSTAVEGDAPVSPSRRQPVSTQQLYLMQYQVHTVLHHSI